jgi:hypothetical protein
MKKATATSHGKKRFTASIEIADGTGATAASAAGLMTAASGFIGMGRKYRSRRLISMRVAFWMNHAFTSTRRGSNHFPVAAPAIWSDDRIGGEGSMASSFCGGTLWNPGSAANGRLSFADNNWEICRSFFPEQVAQLNVNLKPLC